LVRWTDNRTIDFIVFFIVFADRLRPAQRPRFGSDSRMVAANCKAIVFIVNRALLGNSPLSKLRNVIHQKN
jgi:hypothetical protein